MKGFGMGLKLWAHFESLWMFTANVVFLPSSPGTVLTVQALSEDDHKFWIQAMGGKEPVSHAPTLLCHLCSLTLSCRISTVFWNENFIK